MHIPFRIRRTRVYWSSAHKFEDLRTKSVARRGENELETNRVWSERRPKLAFWLKYIINYIINIQWLFSVHQCSVIRLLASQLAVETTFSHAPDQWYHFSCIRIIWFFFPRAHAPASVSVPLYFFSATSASRGFFLFFFVPFLIR